MSASTGLSCAPRAVACSILCATKEHTSVWRRFFKKTLVSNRNTPNSTWSTRRARESDYTEWLYIFPPLFTINSFHTVYCSFLICQVCWDAATAHKSIKLSQDLQQAWGGDERRVCVMSTQPTDDFTVRFSPCKGGQGDLRIGVTTNDAFRPDYRAFKAGWVCALRLLDGIQQFA